MNYCKNCQCESCQSIKVTNSPDVKARNEALRLIKRSGDAGMTIAELGRFSRHFRVFDSVMKESIIDELIMSGLIVQHTFKPMSGRGKSRNAFLAVTE